ncbi:hypothetical protein GGX14DRAFT_405252 [Mycena pura]|uniref:Uncharacterized protein n=1 Tax=Mycena pura TaxID=153505 RepID=A0AAD6USI2_9AGAR|nr:hypothetical protein GGX14DRAFT_405252 [Mycena pura]
MTGCNWVWYRKCRRASAHAFAVVVDHETQYALRRKATYCPGPNGQDPMLNILYKPAQSQRHATRSLSRHLTLFCLSSYLGLWTGVKQTHSGTVFAAWSAEVFAIQATTFNIALLLLDAVTVERDDQEDWEPHDALNDIDNAEPHDALSDIDNEEPHDALNGIDDAEPHVVLNDIDDMWPQLHKPDPWNEVDDLPPVPERRALPTRKRRASPTYDRLVATGTSLGNKAAARDGPCPRGIPTVWTDRWHKGDMWAGLANVKGDERPGLAIVKGDTMGGPASPLSKATRGARASLANVKGDAWPGLAIVKGDTWPGLTVDKGDTQSCLARDKGDGRASLAFVKGSARACLANVKGDTQSGLADVKGDAGASLAFVKGVAVRGPVKGDARASLALDKGYARASLTVDKGGARASPAVVKSGVCTCLAIVKQDARASLAVDKGQPLRCQRQRARFTTAEPLYGILTELRRSHGRGFAAPSSCRFMAASAAELRLVQTILMLAIDKCIIKPQYYLHVLFNYTLSQ